MAFAAAGVPVGSGIFNNTTIYPSYPSGVATSSPLFLFVAHANNPTVATKTITVPATWQLLQQSSFATARGFLYYTKASGTVSSTVKVSVQITTDTTSGSWAAFIVRWTGIVETTTAITLQGFAGANSTLHATQGSTTTGAADFLQFGTNNNAITYTTWPGYTLNIQGTAGNPTLTLQSTVYNSSASVPSTDQETTAAAVWMTIGITVESNVSAPTTGFLTQSFGGMTLSARAGMAVTGNLLQNFAGMTVLSSATPGGNTGFLNPRTFGGFALTASGTPGGNSGALLPQFFGSLGLVTYGIGHPSTVTASTGVKFVCRGRRRMKARNR